MITYKTLVFTVVRSVLPAIANKVSEWKERVAKIASGEIARDADMDPEENLYPPEEVGCARFSLCCFDFFLRLLSF